MTTTLITGAGPVVTGGDDGPRSGLAVAIRSGRIEAVGPEADVAKAYPRATRFDCGGRLVTPGFVDSHTHAVFGRWRAGEYAQRCRGVPYMEIARQGGGINASVEDLRRRTEDELVELTRPRLAAMLRHGTTTAEVKSGYGLTVEDELKMLRVIRRLQEEGPMDLVSTFLGAHEFPAEYRQKRAAYVSLVTEEMIPRVAEEGLAVYCDVFMEPGVFTALQTRRILEAGLQHGLIPRLHADELENSGGAELAAELGAASADHLGAVSAAGVRALARSNTVATLLPATLFFLGRRKYAPARRLLDAGATVALATDFNPGSSTNPNLQLVLTMACSQMGMTPTEALRAATVGGARALRLEDGRGALREGGVADFVVWETDDVDHLGYRYGTNLVHSVWKRGVQVA